MKKHKSSKKPKLLRKSTAAYRVIYQSGYWQGQQDAQTRVKADYEKQISDMHAAVLDDTKKRTVLNLAGQSIQSLANLGEAYARIIMYGSDQRYAKLNEKKGW